MVQISENKIRENNCYLNLILDFGDLTPERRIKEFKKFQKNFKVQFNHRISDILKESRILDYGFKLRDIQDYRTFNLFKYDKITIEASIDENDQGKDCEVYPESLSMTDKNGRKVIIVQNERDLIQDLEFLSKGAEFYSGDLNSITKKIVDLIIPNKINDYTLWKIPRHSITKKITENSRSFIRTMKEIVRVKTNSNKNIIYFEDSSIFPYYNKFSNFVVGDFDNYIVLEGKINSIPSIKYKYSKPESDQIKSGKKIKSLNIRIVSDIKSKIREFKEILITVDENIEFFEGMNLQIGTKVKGYGILKYGNYNEPTISLNYLEVIKQSSEKIQYFIERTGRRTLYWENDDEGIWKRGYDNKENNIVFEKRLTESPLQLVKLYVNDDDMQLYEVIIGGNSFIGSLDSILEQIKKGDKNIIVSKEGLDEAVVNLLREIQRNKNLTSERVFSCVGIHLDETKKLVLVIPQLTQIIPLNAIQEKIIDQLKNTEIFVPKSNYDENEKEEIRKIILNYYNLLIIEGKLDLVFALVIFGFTGIAPFFKALSQKKKKIDVFPGYFAVGMGGVGKSTLFDLLNRIFYGINPRDGKNIDSPARLPEFLSGSTLPLYVDEIDYIKKTSQIINQLKSYTTNMEDSMTMTRDRKLVFTNINCTIMGTANTIDWLNMDDAFREGRTVLTRHKKNSNYEKYASIFEDISYSIKDSKACGYLFLSEAIKYIKDFGKFGIDKKDQVKIRNDLDVLEYIILEKRKYIAQLCKSNNIRLSDPRRITINAFILVSLSIWKFIFNKYLPEYPNIILDKFLENKSDHLLDFIKEFEDATIEKKKEDLYAILSFIESEYNYETKIPILMVDRIKEVIYLTHRFLGEYNDYARRKSFRIFRSLPQLGEYFEQIDPEVKITVNFRWESCGKSKRGVNLEYRKLTGNKIPDSKMEEIKKDDDGITLNSISKNILSKEIQVEIKEFIKEFAKNNQNRFTFEDIWETIARKPNLTEDNLSLLFEKWINEKYLQEKGDFFSIMN
ncbi:hypothetical protein DSAG12_04345 [Promethearchaeum syntrophicum]|uniref:Uncharacterized protein n=1 Tax=Promethearchaeum syntrophicum TaxID=2594042 RepID=A0AC61ZU11_9ARCH